MVDGKLVRVQALLDEGKLIQAKAICEPLCGDMHTGSASAWLMLGTIDELLGAVDESLNALNHAIQIQPDLAEAHMKLGRLLNTQGNTHDAVESFKRAVKYGPDDSGAYLCLATALEHQGRYAEAIGYFDTVFALEPANVDAMVRSGMCYLKLCKYTDADALFQKALLLQASHTGAFKGLGYSALARKNFTEAIRYLQKALDGNRPSAVTHYDLGACLAQAGNPVDALKHLREATRLAPDHLAARIGIVSLLLATGKQDEVLDACDQVLRLQPDNLDVLAMSAQMLLRGRKHAQAVERLRPVMGMSKENVRVGLVLAALADNLEQYDRAIDDLEQLMATGRVQAADERRRVLFSLGRLCDKVGDYDKAFGYYREGNDMVISATTHDALASRAQLGQTRVDGLKSIHSVEQHASLPRASNTCQLPVFIVGMPRSGTTLVEQILASHPEIYGAGELNWLPKLADDLQIRAGCPVPYPQCMKSISGEILDEIAGEYLDRLAKLGGAVCRVTDKMPGNYNLLGLVDLLFPASRVIHCVRNPLDTCLSIYFQEFQKGHTYSGDLTDVGHIYLQYRELMTHWNKTLSIPVMDIHYEAMIADQEGMSRKLINFCGLPWDRQCLKFYENDRTIRTASFNQANKPIYLDSINRWRNYDAWLGPLREVLRNIESPIGNQ